MIKTMKVSELIKALKDVKKLMGDAPVFLSGDSEGNSYGSVDVCSIFGGGGVIIISPWMDGLTDEEIGLLENKDEEELVL